MELHFNSRVNVYEKIMSENPTRYDSRVKLKLNDLVEEEIKDSYIKSLRYNPRTNVLQNKISSGVY